MANEAGPNVLAQAIDHAQEAVYTLDQDNPLRSMLDQIVPPGLATDGNGLFATDDPNEWNEDVKEVADSANELAEAERDAAAERDQAVQEAEEEDQELLDEQAEEQQENADEASEEEAEIAEETEPAADRSSHDSREPPAKPGDE
jgi:hypothetical protein